MHFAGRGYPNISGKVTTGLGERHFAFLIVSAVYGVAFVNVYTEFAWPLSTYPFDAQGPLPLD